MKTLKAFFKWGMVAVLATILIGFGAWWCTGGRWYIMSTASMSPHLPVGTLVLTRPLVGQPKVGGIYAFIPPSQTNVFIHQVVDGNASTGFHTKGYMNSNVDPWAITKANVQAVAVAWFPGLGWLLLALPIWLGIALLWGFGRRVVAREWWRWSLSWAGSLAVALPVLLWRFLVNGEVVTALTRHGVVHMYLVSTGILPASVSVAGKPLGILPAGQAKAFTAVLQSAHRLVVIGLRGELPWWGWGLLGLICLFPLLYSVWLLERECPHRAGGTGHLLLSD
jgi:hypothetical protein